MKNHQRPIWIIVFAILLACIAIRTKGQEPTGSNLILTNLESEPPASETNAPSTRSKSIQIDSESDAGPEMTEIQFGNHTFIVPKAKQSIPPNTSQQPKATDRAPARRGLRPASVAVTAELAYLDSHSDPDGWNAHITLLDANDCPVVVPRASAKFELIPRLPTHDFTGFVNANVKSMTWTTPLRFADNKTATAQLRLRRPIEPLTGWASTSHPAVGSAGGFFSSRRGVLHHSTPDFAPRTTLIDRRQRAGAFAAIGMARYGQLRVRVSIPGEGVFDAVTPVDLRPPVLVDTQWPYQ